MTTLLDVNVLVALAWPNHVHHGIARSWFEKNHAKGWATCSITENGFVRISANPQVVEEARTPPEAIAFLERLTRVEGHRFWNDDVSVTRSDAIDVERIRGHRQVMDAHLLGLAIRHRGRLATFDRRIEVLLGGGAERSRRLLVLE